jgi:predicted nucleic acid-binding protein
MGRVIDSTVLVAAERRQLDFQRLRGELAGEPLVLAAITASELLEGVHRADTEARRIGREAFVENLLRSLRVIPFDLAIARVHARLRAGIPRNRQIGTHDLMIGATAVALGYGVLTRDRRSFPRIPDLRVDVA